MLLPLRSRVNTSVSPSLEMSDVSSENSLYLNLTRTANEAHQVYSGTCNRPEFCKIEIQLIQRHPGAAGWSRRDSVFTAPAGREGAFARRSMRPVARFHRQSASDEARSPASTLLPPFVNGRVQAFDKRIDQRGASLRLQGFPWIERGSGLAVTRHRSDASGPRYPAAPLFRPRAEFPG